MINIINLIDYCPRGEILYTPQNAVTDALPWLKYILELSLENLVVDDPWLHIDNNGPRLQIIDHSASLQINLTILAWVHIAKETTKGLIIDATLVVLGMFS